MSREADEPHAIKITLFIQTHDDYFLLGLYYINNSIEKLELCFKRLLFLHLTHVHSVKEAILWPRHDYLL